MADHNCDCLSQGPALLPVRYAVAPDALPGSLPGWASSGALNYPQHENYHYALRTVRRGFIYIYYPFLTKWDAWSVSDDGSLWKQFSANNAVGKSEPDCKQGSYSQGGKDFITLVPEVLDNDIWIAFSQSPWLPSTLTRYQQETARAKRMQCLRKSQWLTPTAAPYAGLATAENISAVLDYMPASSGAFTPSAMLPWGTHGDFRVSHVSNEGNYSLARKVQPQETIYPWKTMRSGLSASTAQQMSLRGVRADGSPVAPLIIALHDTVGISHELTGWTNDVLALPKIYGDERALEFSTQSLISGAEQLITKSAEQKVAAQVEGIFDSDPINLDMAYFWYEQNEHRKGTPPSDIMSREEYGNQGKAQQKKVMNKTQVADDLAKYKRMLHQAKLDSFIFCCDTLTGQVEEQVNSLIDFRSKWLEDTGFITTTQDFYSQDAQDNLYYREIVAFAISGINIGATGRALLDKWINAYTTTNEKNLVWRTHFFNNPELMADGESLLGECRQYTAEPMTQTNLLYFFETNGAKLNKIFKGFEKATATLAKPLGDNPMLSTRVLYMTDQYMATVGARVFSSTRLGSALDTASDTINRTLFSLAAGKTQAETQVFLSKYVGWAMQRSAYLDGLGFFKFNPARVKAERDLWIASKRFTAMDNAFSQYAATTPGHYAYKTSSIKILVLIFNMIELYNQLDHYKGDATSYAKISSAILATAGGIADIATPAFEHGLQAGHSLQYLKMVGAGSSLVAAGISLGLDFQKLITQSDSNSPQKLWIYRSLYFVKVLNDIATLTSAEGKLMSALITRFGWDTTKGSMGLWLGRAATPRLVFLGIEWIGVLSSWWLALVIMASEYVITEYFSRDDLQLWYEQGIFGNDNTLNSDGLNPEKMESLIEERRNTLMACLRKMASPHHEAKPAERKNIVYWPFRLYEEKEENYQA